MHFTGAGGVNSLAPRRYVNKSKNGMFRLTVKGSGRDIAFR